MIDKAGPIERYFARAVERGDDMFAAQYGAPGLISEIVKNNRDGTEELSNTAVRAELLAARILLKILNTRAHALRNQGKNRYPHLTPAQFAQELAAVEVTPTWFAEIYGTNQKRILDWLEGNEPVSHPARVLLFAMRRDPALAAALETFVGQITEERPRRASEAAK